MPHETTPGRVLLVGAGPGPADLLTLRAARAIQSADALLYDALVGDEALALAPEVCTRIQTGKRAGRASMAQDAINRLMLRLAQRGLRVVRLKGGDPSIFGRSGEEVEWLSRHGVEVEVIPGVTAASAAAAQFGFPLTHRGEARRLVFATGATREGAMRLGAETPAGSTSTLVLYMGRDNVETLFRDLIEGGRARTTAALAVENAGHPHARFFRGDLASLPAKLNAAAPRGPVVIVVGDVASRAIASPAGEAGLAQQLQLCS